MQFRFDAFTLDTGSRELIRDGQPVRLSPKAFELLRVLLECRPQAVSKTDLHARLWPGTFVTDTSLATLVSEVRAALGDDPRRPRFLRTVHRFGYAFCGDAVTLRGTAPAPAARCWLEWDGRELPLAEGENLLGRASDSTVRIELPEISRRHARLVVEGRRAVLEDLGSRNGTYIGATRLTAGAPLTDGAEIRLGTVRLIFRVGLDGGTTQAVPRTGEISRNS